MHHEHVDWSAVVTAVAVLGIITSLPALSVGYPCVTSPCRHIDTCRHAGMADGVRDRVQAADP